MWAKVTVYGEKVSAGLNKKIIKAIEDTLSENGLDPFDFAVDVNFVSRKRMRELNRNFRQKDYATDVLSFGQFEDVACGQPKSPGPVMLGDIVLCRDVIEKESREEMKTYEEQLLMLVAHSTLHLIGIHHEED